METMQVHPKEFEVFQIIKIEVDLNSYVYKLKSYIANCNDCIYFILDYLCIL